MAPESNQTSMTSGVRRIVPPHSHGHVTSSMYGLCGSNGSGSPPASSRPARRTSRSRRVRGIGVADPDRQRRAPVALARDRPVDVALEPLAEPAVPTSGGCHATCALFASICSFTASCGCTTSRAPCRAAGCGSASSAGTSASPASSGTRGRALAQRLDQHGIRVLHEHAADQRDALAEPAGVVDRPEHRQAVPLPAA
jgi:hypothetical protein